MNVEAERVWEHRSDRKGRRCAKDGGNNDGKPVVLGVKGTKGLKVQCEGKKKVKRFSLRKPRWIEWQSQRLNIESRH